MRYRLDGVVTLVDAVNGGTTLDQHIEAVKQAAVADRIVVSKADLLDSPERRAAGTRLTERLRALNPAAPVLDAAAGEATPERLLGCGLFDPQRKIPDVSRWLAEDAYAGHGHDHDHPHDRNRHDDRIRAFTLAADEPIPGATFEMFIDLVRSLHGPNLLRLKGIVNLAESPERPLVIHGVQHVMHPPAYLEAWPDADRRTRIVVIARDLPPHSIQRLFDAFRNRVAADLPDRAALTDNPLVPFGGADR
jgi:G3E family GTPase